MNPPLPPQTLRDLSAQLAEGIEELAALSLHAQEAAARGDFSRASTDELRQLQGLDLITQSLEAYAAFLRELARCAPPDLALPPGILTKAFHSPPAAQEDSDGTVIWF